MASFITVAADINGSVTLRLDPSTSDKVFNREMVNSAMAEVQQIIENHYKGQLTPFSDVKPERELGLGGGSIEATEHAWLGNARRLGTHP
jgi:hypothetical protein